MSDKIDFELTDAETNEVYIISINNKQLNRALDDENYYKYLLKKAKEDYFKMNDEIFNDYDQPDYEDDNDILDYLKRSENDSSLKKSGLNSATGFNDNHQPLRRSPFKITNSDSKVEKKDTKNGNKESKSQAIIKKMNPKDINNSNVDKEDSHRDKEEDSKVIEEKARKDKFNMNDEIFNDYCQSDYEDDNDILDYLKRSENDSTFKKSGLNSATGFNDNRQPLRRSPFKISNSDNKVQKKDGKNGNKESKSQAINKKTYSIDIKNSDLDKEDSYLDEDVSKVMQDFKWSKPMVLLLLHCYKECQSEFNNPKSTKVKVWKKLATSFNKNGYDLLPEQCRMKFQALVRQYKKCIDHNGKSGNNRKGFEYKEEMDNLFAKDVWVAPISTAASDKYSDSDSENNYEYQPKKRKRRQCTNEILIALLDEQKKSREQQKDIANEVTSLLKQIVNKV